MEQGVIDRPTYSRTKFPRAQAIEEILKNPLTVQRELNNRSLYEFITCFWHVIVNDEFKTNWHIELLCEELEKVAYRVANNLPKLYDLIFNVPPGSTKTIICSIMFPAWCWTQWHWMRFITASYSDKLTLESAEHSRDLIRSEEFRQLYPELEIKVDKDAKGNFKVVKKEYVSPGRLPRLHQGGSRFSTSVGGTSTGFHAHIIIWDDLLNPKQAASEVELDNANAFLSQTLSTRKTDKKVSAVVGIMQRLAQNDPTGFLLDRKKGSIRLISLPGEIRNYRDQVSPKELIKYYKGDLLDPVRLGWDALKELEAELGQYGYAGQVGQKPTPPGGGMFKVDHFMMVQRLPDRVEYVHTVRYWDKAGSDGKGAFTVGVKMSKLIHGHYIIEDVKRGQWASEQREKIIRQTAEADGRGVEIGVEQEPGSGGKESAESTIRNLAGFSCFKDKPGKGDGNKAFRADPYSVQVNNGNVMMLTADWNHKYVDELRNFPFSTFKDQTDASSGAFHKLTGKRIARRVI